MKTFLMTAAAVCAFTASAVQAETMTFAGVTTSFVTGPYVENGITMTPPTGGGYYGYQSNGTVHLDQGSSNGIYDFTFANGLFNLVSIDVATSYGASGLGTFTAFDAANTQIGTVSFSASTVGTKLLSLTNVSRLRLVATGSHFNIDNLVLNAAAVPEPATWGMMIAGFGVMGAAMRTRRRSTNVTFA